MIAYVLRVIGKNPADHSSPCMIIIRFLWLLQLASFLPNMTLCAATKGANTVVDDISVISQYWGNTKPYRKNQEDLFGVKHTGLPEGCQVEQVQILHRHAARYPTDTEKHLMLELAAKVSNRNSSARFTGPLSFLNTWTLQIGIDSLTQAGVGMAYVSGTDFWVRYGRLLYNATPTQTGYSSASEKKPLLRCNTLPRVFDTANAWAGGFFGQYNATSKYSLLAIPFIYGQNNTLASYLSCPNLFLPNSILGGSIPSSYVIVPFFLTEAASRLSTYAPPSITFTAFDAVSMQSLCTYEFIALGSSEFCKLFTLKEWEGFEYLSDSSIYNYAGFGSPAGRALGLGVLQEILARLKNENIQSSTSSVNSTLDSDPATFPLNQKFYADFTHDHMIAGVLTAMSLDYFRKPLPPIYPPPNNIRFRVSNLTPYAARLVVEKIGCNSAAPKARKNTLTQYSNGQYGYSSSKASHKFVRIRLNNAILPLKTIRGGKCNIRRRTDGLCPLANFLASQSNAEALANYQVVCFGNYTYNASLSTGDGNFFPPN